MEERDIHTTIMNPVRTNSEQDLRDKAVCFFNSGVMKNAVLQKINEVIAFNCLSKRAFDNRINMEQTTVNNQLIGKRGISIDLIINTLLEFPEVSAEWLLRGEGEMLKSPSTSETFVDISKYVTEIESLKAEINQLKGENRVLREQMGLGERKDSDSQSA